MNVYRCMHLYSYFLGKTHMCFICQCVDGQQASRKNGGDHWLSLHFPAAFQVPLKSDVMPHDFSLSHARKLGVLHCSTTATCGNPL